MKPSYTKQTVPLQSCYTCKRDFRLMLKYHPFREEYLERSKSYLALAYFVAMHPQSMLNFATRQPFWRSPEASWYFGGAQANRSDMLRHKVRIECSLAH